MLKFHAEREFRRNRIALTIVEEAGNVLAVAVPLVMKVVGENEVVDPAMYMKPDEGQALIDALWDAGLRPSEGSGSAGALLATQQHLKDMRAIVFKQLDVTP
jgi:hypothetical protein